MPTKFVVSALALALLLPSIASVSTTAFAAEETAPAALYPAAGSDTPEAAPVGDEPLEAEESLAAVVSPGENIEEAAGRRRPAPHRPAAHKPHVAAKPHHRPHPTAHKPNHTSPLPRRQSIHHSGNDGPKMRKLDPSYGRADPSDPGSGKKLDPSYGRNDPSTGPLPKAYKAVLENQVREAEKAQAALKATPNMNPYLKMAEVEKMKKGIEAKRILQQHSGNDGPKMKKLDPSYGRADPSDPSSGKKLDPSYGRNEPSTGPLPKAYKAVLENQVREAERAQAALRATPNMNPYLKMAEVEKMRKGIEAKRILEEHKDAE